MYPITQIKGDPSFDKLLIQKLGCTTEVPINDRVFAIAQAGISHDSFFARIQSFEYRPSDVTLRLVLCHGDNTLQCTATEKGVVTLTVNGTEAEGVMTSYLISGEDLQGEYWGAVFILPLHFFEEVLACKAEKGLTLLGNFVREGTFESAAFQHQGRLIVE